MAIIITYLLYVSNNLRYRGTRIINNMANGRVIKTSTAGGTTRFNWRFHNAGTVEVRSGILELNGGGQDSGT